MLQEVMRMSASGKLDYIVIEGSGIAEPQPIADAFLEAARGIHVTAKLDTLVTVVDAERFLEDYLATHGDAVSRHLDDAANKDKFKKNGKKNDKKEKKKNRNQNMRVGDRQDLIEGEGADKNDRRQVAQLLVDQVEVANVIVLNKMDLMDRHPEKQQLLHSIITSLNPHAVLVPSSFSRVDLNQILGTNLFQPSSIRGGLMMGGGGGSIMELMPNATGNRSFQASISGAAQIASFVYERRNKPFHPKRLHELVTGWRQGSNQRILRAKG
jgi:G3E family GTPase